MRYWGYLAAKLVGLGLAVLGLLKLPIFVGTPTEMHGVRLDPFGHDLRFTLLVLLYAGAVWAVFLGSLWLAIWDQRYRCRTCLRRLRMPVATGIWTQVLFGRSRVEYICPYGHGTLRVEELQITGHSGPDWQPHEDMWKELAKK